MTGHDMPIADAEAAAGAPTLRQRLHRQLFAGAWGRPGLSPANRVLAVLIVAASTLAVLETEPSLYDDRRVAAAFGALDLLFGIVFSVEYGLRLWAAGEEPRYRGPLGRVRYALTPAALLDLAALTPFLLSAGAADAYLLRLFRLLRIVLLARLGRMSQALGALLRGIRERAWEMGLAFGVCFAFLLAVSTLLYIIEGAAQPEAFGSIPRALWWGVATLTTVGYGDVYPVTPLGKLVGGLCALAAIGVIALPAGIMAAAFSEVFRKET